MLYLLLLSLVATIIIEYLVILMLYRSNPGTLLLYVIFINSFTQPIATYGFNYLSGNFFFIEFAVTISESVLLMLLLQIPYKKALLYSIAANLVTASIGWYIFLS
ncbi:MAG: hypothetical protein EA359_10450 [Balneolaceae bacterium]|nr:MAG: hypothetical protein EA359_10450 [Balneolaceae bacterium]